MKRVVLWVELDIKPGRIEDALAAARRDAEGSVAHEPGCRRFDVLQDPGQPDKIFLYEVYDDAAAVAAHRETAHFKAYAEATQALVAGRRVLRLDAEETCK